MRDRIIRHGSLFSGIGGFDLAAEWMGWENVFHCEINEFCQKVLNHHFPKAQSYADITTTDFTVWRGKVDIITGGFPCQPFSIAGKRKGTEDDRYLWKEMLRAIREIQPNWVVGENVHGIVNWSRGMVFEQVQADLENEGYHTQAYVLPACGVNAPHRRERVWFVAHSTSNSRRNEFRNERHNSQAVSEERFNECLITPHSNGNGFNGSNGEHEKYAGEGREYALGNIESVCEHSTTNSNGKRYTGKEYGQKEAGQYMQYGCGNGWQDFPTQSPLCGRNDGLPSQLDGITFSKWRNESIKALGNAIVPQVALQIFKAIEQYHLR